MEDMTEKVPESFKPLKRSAWKPIVREGDGSVLASKFSGKPFLKPGETWPVCPNCEKPMQLFLQLDLDTLPEPVRDEFGGGLLQLFYCTNSDPECVVDCDAWEPFAESELVRVIKLEGQVSEPEIPEGSRFFPAKLIVGWQLLEDYPSLDEAETIGLLVSDEEEENYYDSDLPLQDDKLAGWPAWVQGIEYPECPVCQATMRLVFQIDSEDNLPYMFGDSGCGHITQCPVHKEQVAFAWACC